MENIEAEYGAVRKVTKNAVSLTGKVYVPKEERHVRFESSLERDFVIRNSFDPNVDAIKEQPIKIDFEDDYGVSDYTPDFLIFYNNHGGPEFKPHLFEVKYRADIKKRWPEFKRKWKAALEYCDKMNWEFKVVTEVEIRTDYLFNAKFLKRYNNSKFINREDFINVLSCIQEEKETTPQEVINKFESRSNSLLYTLWYLVANYYVGTDLNRKLTMESRIWSMD